MAFNLLDTVNGLFSGNVITKAASTLGETEGGIQKAIGGVVPSVLAGILNRAGSGGSSPVNLLNMAREASGSGVLNNLSGFLGIGSEGSGRSGLLNMASSIFGDKLDNVIGAIASFAGIKSSSASSLVNLAAPAALGVSGKHASDNNLSAGGILRMLDSQKDRILSAVPSGLGLASALGIGNLGNIGSKITSALSGVTSEVKKKVNWLPILLTALAVGLLIYFLTSRKSDTTASTDIVSDTATTIVAPVETTAPATPTAPSIKVQLPDGKELDAFRGGIEDKLVMFLNDASSKADKDAWFDFDNLNFETGSATITPGSQQQVNNIAAILKAYPKVKIKVGGYTDRTGDAATNKKLSQDRADAVVAALKAAGTNSAQLVGAEGYGSAFATVAAEASEEERKKDRRIAVSVREK